MTSRTPDAGQTPSQEPDRDPQEAQAAPARDNQAQPMQDQALQDQAVQDLAVQVQGVRIPGDQLPEVPEVPLRLVHGNASPEELSALIAVVAVLSSAEGDEGDAGGSGQGDRPSSGSRTYPRSRWSSPARMVRTTHPHGPGGWRASAFPRYRSNRPAGPLHTSG